ncbi:ATP synthetase subunit E (plastid) [Nitzschia inconspicua]|uniref:ATP synthetase subunit E n=1 Tax=Nitzschia inconspicua TaxID=303405 RepID=A0A8H2SIB2_9STRA|nr:ATP synthetase subunit E [Nitzschia inconspicua]
MITALDTGLLRIKLDEKWTPIILCGGLAEIDRNRVTVLVNDVEELINIELNEATKELEKAAVAVEEAETSKARLDASVELKKATARLEAMNYLS